jgi:hypothetical protein
MTDAHKEMSPFTPCGVREPFRGKTFGTGLYRNKNNKRVSYYE